MRTISTPARKPLRAPVARGGAHTQCPACARDCDQRASDEARRTGHQNAHQVLLRENVVSSQPTIALPSASVARSTRGSGSIALHEREARERHVEHEDAHDDLRTPRSRCRWRADRSACGVPATPARV